MTAKTQQMLNDKAWARWLALILIASMMFFAYMFVDVMSPLKSLLEEKLHWDSASFGTYAASEYFLNVFFFFLIFAGIILDKMGIRFTGVLSASSPVPVARQLVDLLPRQRQDGIVRLHDFRLRM